MAATTKTRLSLARLLLGALALFALIQLVPYGREHANPPVVKEPSWDQPATRALAVRACFDCHSNQTKWPWYSSVAPMSWLVQDHIDEGRRKLNFSEWQRTYKHADDAAEELREGEMPLPSYTLLHPEARLSPAEKSALEHGLQATLGGKASAARSGDDDDDDE